MNPKEYCKKRKRVSPTEPSGKQPRKRITKMEREQMERKSKQEDFLLFLKKEKKREKEEEEEEEEE